MTNFQEIHIEKDFWDDFIVEAFEHIEEIATNAMSLEQNPEDMDIIHTMFRAFHTIKGLSGFVEHTMIQEVAHKTETMMDLCRKGELKVNTKIVDAILKSSDYIKQLCENIDAYKDENLVDNIEILLTVLEELSNTDDAPQAQQEPEVVAQIVEEKVIEETVFEFYQEDVPEIVQKPSQKEIVQEEASDLTITEEISAEEINEELESEESSPELHEELSLEEVIAQELVTDESVVAEEVVEEQEIHQEAAKEEEIVFEVKLPEEPAMPEVAKAPEPVSVNIGAESEKSAPKFAEAPKTEMYKENTAAKSVAASEEYMKVANYRIDHLVDMISELIINQSLIEQYVFANYSEDRQLTTNMSGFLRITRELQNLSMSLRMVSLKPTFQKLNRVARDTIQELHKNVEFVTSGEGTEIDRVVAEKLLDPLVHMIKNAISHGIEEDPQDRDKLNKPQRAKVELNAYSKRGKIFIEVKDDGRGINTDIVYKKAIEKGLIDPAKTYSEAEIKEFIMLPGFSTAKVVDNISGRGVGMDVVKTQIAKTGGKVDIQSTLNKGSTFTLEVPVNHAIMNGTIIEMNQQQFVVPTINVKEFLQPSEDQWISTKMQRTMIKVRDNIIPIVPLSVFFKGIKDDKNVPLVMILELEQELRAVPITNVINRQEVVVKPVGEEFNHLKYISGMSILGTGKVSLILDIDYLFRKEVKE